MHPFAVGIVEDRPLEEYLAGPEVSSGKLVAFEKAPALVYGQEAEEKETPAMARGTLIHCAILEPDEVERRFFRSELAVFNPRHNAYKEEVARAGGRTLAKAADYDNALRMRDGLFRNRVAREVLIGSRTEVTAYWRHAPTSLECRCGLDRRRLVRGRRIRPGRLPDLRLGTQAPLPLRHLRDLSRLAQPES
ncbi:MAG: PD-(D/E)XK nuclease-like domain-containing protein [Roseomonas mucosa]|nr:PD-(D/E)XK nuclease-like domain-containing protein [Roseomonas mucosa]